MENLILHVAAGRRVLFCSVNDCSIKMSEVSTLITGKTTVSLFTNRSKHIFFVTQHRLL